MTRKTADAYICVFNFIDQNLIKLMPTEFMTDYEDGMRLAIRTHWPEVRIRGCWFHYKRALNRRCRSISLKRVLDKSINAYKVKEMLVSIPLLPSTKILEGFGSIKTFAAQNKLDKCFDGLFSYFERYWLKQVSYQCSIAEHLIT